MMINRGRSYKGYRVPEIRVIQRLWNRDSEKRAPISLRVLGACTSGQIGCGQGYEMQGPGEGFPAAGGPCPTSFHLRLCGAKPTGVVREEKYRPSGHEGRGLG